MRSCPPGSTPLLTDLEPTDRSSGRQCRLERQVLAGSRRLKDCSSITVSAADEPQCCLAVRHVLLGGGRCPGTPEIVERQEEQNLVVVGVTGSWKKKKSTNSVNPSKSAKKSA